MVRSCRPVNIIAIRIYVHLKRPDTQRKRKRIQPCSVLARRQYVPRTHKRRRYLVLD